MFDDHVDEVKACESLGVMIKLRLVARKCFPFPTDSEAVISHISSDSRLSVIWIIHKLVKSLT